MLRLLDGPCKGSYMCKRAPLFLRAVVAGTETDCLDQIEDTPAENEVVYVYHRVGSAGTIHLHARGKNGKNASGWYAMADYEYMTGVDGQQFRNNEVWQRWATLRAAISQEMKRSDAKTET